MTRISEEEEPVGDPTTDFLMLSGIDHGSEEGRKERIRAAVEAHYREARRRRGRRAPPLPKRNDPDAKY